MGGEGIYSTDDIDKDKLKKFEDSYAEAYQKRVKKRIRENLKAIEQLKKEGKW